ncbi:MAG: type I restriction-modification system subunit M [Bacilli bacterium]|nr:type I restriction-modification system subunit M [Bacilli bacterium]
MITSEEIKRRLWDGANELRGSMDASRYKDYMLGLMFYKFLSDKTLDAFKVLAKSNNVGKQLVKEYKEASLDLGQDLYKGIQRSLGYYVAPEYLYQTWLEDINEGKFEVQKVTDSLHSFERTIATNETHTDFKGLFSSSTIDLTDTALGSSLNERNKNIQALIKLFADLDMISLQKGDVLGDAYEYLIGQFAMESGKKAGEFYTPRQVSEVMAQIVAKTTNINSVYDPTVGSGSLLLTVSKHLSKDKQNNLKYYGQEKNTATYNLTRMNLILHGVRPEKMNIKNGDTLAEDWPEDPSRPNEGYQFDAVVMNPPYSVKNWNRHNLKVSDQRFEVAGVLPPDSKGDYAFLLHGLYHLNFEGTMAIVLPHGVLFRGGTEGEIRQRLLEKNLIDAVIGLPSNLFTNTGIPVTVLILKKNRNLDSPVLLIDASKHFTKIGKNNVLLDKDISRLVDTYIKKEETKGYSHLATRDKIIENEYNLNIPRYVENITDEIKHDVDAHLYGGIPEENIKDLSILNKELNSILYNNLVKVRDGYFELNKPIEDLEKEVLNSKYLKDNLEAINYEVKEFLNKYFEKIKIVDDKEKIKDLMDEMLDKIKELLSKYSFLNEYDGYQIISDIWKESLLEDTEIISNIGYYEAGNTKVPNYVTKGTGEKKRQVQEGFKGLIIDKDILVETLFSLELNKINQLKNNLSEIESEISELVESAKVEESFENETLFDSLNKNADDEPTGSINKTELNKALKDEEKNSDKYNLIVKTIDLLNDEAKTKKDIKDQEEELINKVYSKLETLTNEEIDQLMFKKWFGNILLSINNMIEEPFLKEINTLKVLKERYSNTLEDLDREINTLEQEFNEMLKDLVTSNDK